MDKPLDALHVSCRSKGCPRCNSRSAQTCPAISTMYLYAHVYSTGDNDKSCALSSDQTCSDDPQSADPCINAARGERSERSQCTLLGGCCMPLHDTIVVFGKGILRFLALATQPPKRKSRRQENDVAGFEHEQDIAGGTWQTRPRGYINTRAPTQRSGSLILHIRGKDCIRMTIPTPNGKSQSVSRRRRRRISAAAQEPAGSQQ